MDVQNRDDLSLNDLQELLQEATPSLQSLHPEEGVDRYLKRRKGEITPGTVDKYRRRLAYFLQFCELRDIEDLNELDGRLVDDYRVWRRDEATVSVESLGPKTMKDEMHLFSAFLRYLEGVDAVRPGLAENVVIPDLGDRDGVRDVDLEPERVQEILAYLEKYRYASRDHVIWVLHCRTGRRPGAVHSLDVGDVHLGEDPYVSFRHRPERGTRLKNELKSEQDMPIADWVAAVLEDYIAVHRVAVTDEYGREPLLSSSDGRLSKTAMRYCFYAWSRPCAVGAGCPHGEVVEECESARLKHEASKCPSSHSSYSTRHGHITQLRRLGLPKSVISERCDVSEEIIERHYDERSEEERRELHRELIEKIREEKGEDSRGYV